MKVKNLLNRTPKMLREDPILQIEYLKILNLIKTKKLLENTADQYDPTATVHTDYYDVEQLENEQAKKDTQASEAWAQKYDAEYIIS